MGKLHDALKASGYDGHPLERLLVRLLFCLFADDTGIFDQLGLLETYIQDRTAEDGSDLGPKLIHLFQVLNTPTDKRQKSLDEDLNRFPYINGDLFAEVLPIPDFDRAMRERLLEACGFSWQKISPAIFGALFQSVMNAKERRQKGAHYTTEKNILKVIEPLFLDDLRAELARILDLKRGRDAALRAFQDKLAGLNLFDPACGCGNFLIIAYRELRLLEIEVLKALYTNVFNRPGLSRSEFAFDVASLTKVDVDQFNGIEVDEFPARIAETAMWMMDHIMNNRLSAEFGKPVARFPLKARANIVHGDALEVDWATVLPPERCSYVLGNPPFLGHHLQSPGQKAALRRVYGRQGDSAGVMDFVTAWFVKAAEYITGTKIGVAFVATNSIVQGEQVGILWRTLASKKLSIHFGHRTFKWESEARGKAAVYCVIVGFGTEERVPKRIFDYAHPGAEAQELLAQQINAYLVDAPWVLLDNERRSLAGRSEMIYGSKPTDGGNFFFNDAEKAAFLATEPRAAPLIKRFVGAHEYLHSENRWVLWLADADPALINQLPAVKARIKAVARFRSESKARSTRDYGQPALFRQVTQPKSDYVLVPGHTSENRRYIPFGFFSKDVIVGNSCFSIPNVSLADFGILQSASHMAWVAATCGRIKSDFRYSKDIVYNNFPWPTLTDADKTRLDTLAQAVLDARAAYPDATLADLYHPDVMPADLRKAHRALDLAVDRLYRKAPFESDRERVEHLFMLYEKMTAGLLAKPDKPKRRKKADA
ncbi:class I SAM-dependent DNA methyltransferase [Brevundimonas nasdae]|uniref:class I SAM-dependent DNA methyltransferase n=1 Tax=Brevundimonas nasdae TaxID=172043 RepID=UPI003019C918